MRIWDYDTFGMYARLNLRLPTNVLQRFYLWRAKHYFETHTPYQNSLLAMRSMQLLNQHARHRQGDFSDTIYSVKKQFIRTCFLSANDSYKAMVTVQQQILKCKSCHRGIWAYRTNHEDWCYRCKGTGIYKRIRLYHFLFHFNDKAHSFSFHQPDNLAEWAEMYVDEQCKNVPIEELPKYMDDTNAKTVWLSNRELQKHLMIVARYVQSHDMFEKVELSELRGAVREDINTLVQFTTRIIQRWNQRSNELLDRVLGREEVLPF